MKELTEEQIQVLRHLFNECDVDHDGVIGTDIAKNCNT